MVQFAVGKQRLFELQESEIRVTLISSSQKSKSGVYDAEAEFLPARYQSKEGQDTTTPVRGIYMSGYWVIVATSAAYSLKLSNRTACSKKH